MEVHLTYEINALGVLEANSMCAQLAVIKEELAEKSAIVTSPLFTDALMQLFSMPQDTRKLDEVWGTIPAPEPDKREINFVIDLVFLMTHRRMRLIGCTGMQDHYDE